MLITQTPLRVSLFGGTTDFPAYFTKDGGCVLGSAIDKYIYVALNPRIDRRIRVSCTHIQTVSHLRNLRHDLVREAMKLTGIDHGLDIYTMGDIPAGTGLGSSSSVTVGLLKAMHVYTNNDVSAQTLAEEACHIELEVLKKPIGVQDQYLAAVGGFRFFTFDAEGVKFSQNNSRVANELNDRIMLFFTGVTRKSEDILREQDSKTKQNTPFLNEIKSLAYRAVKEIDDGNYDTMGTLLHQSWVLKQKLASGIANKRVGDLYEKALKAGALGGKIAGAGGGGFLLIYSPPENKKAVRGVLRELREVPFRFDPLGSRVIYSK